MKRRLVLELLVSGLLLIAVIKSDFVLMVLKIFVDSFALGHSGSKVKLLLAVYFVIALSSVYKLPWRPRWKSGLIVGLVLLHFLSLASYLFYCFQNGLGILPQNVCFFDGVHSSTRLQHIHTSKLVMATLFEYAGQSLDGGRPYLKFFPNWWCWIHTSIFLVVGVMALSSLQEARSCRNFPLYLCYFLVLITLLKNSLDGGPLDTQTLAAIPFFTWFSGFGVRRGAYISGALMALNLMLSGPDYLAYDLWRFILALITFSLPLAVNRIREDRTLQNILLSCALVFVWTLAPVAQFAGWVQSHRISNAVGTLLYANSELKRDWVVQVVSVGPLQLRRDDSLRIEGFYQGRRLNLTNLRLLKDTQVLALADRFGLNIFRRPISWHPKPAFVSVEGPGPLPEAAEWEQSEFVTAYLVDKSGSLNRLLLELKVGGGINVANEALGIEAYAAQSFRLNYDNPVPSGNWKFLR